MNGLGSLQAQSLPLRGDRTPPRVTISWRSRLQQCRCQAPAARSCSRSSRFSYSDLPMRFTYATTFTRTC
ncbi:hypothetical protein BBKW_1449 [Bifidobacterium catenulatum subsp. kashiwanohense JCM 15439 = DSM 21854]|nr:hypothetical protein BBKW_1449 [Bifidobacterium catenulatum subsp. kashiwanohense JCM 15439 = DSM 21854]